MRVLIADDDRSFAEHMGALVAACGHEVVATVTSGGLAVMQGFTRHRPDLVFVDVMMPKFNGFTVCQQLISRDSNARVILMSGLVASDYPSMSTCHAAGYLPKPMTFNSLQAILEREEAVYAARNSAPEAVAA